MNQYEFMDRLEKTAFFRMQFYGKERVLILDRASYSAMLTEHTRRVRISFTNVKIVSAINGWGGPRTV